MLTTSLPRSCRALVLSSFVAVAFAALPSDAAAQASAGASRWGLSGSMTPDWRITKLMADIITGGEEDVDFHGRELSIGFVRGSIRRGDWGVSFVHKAIDKHSTSLETWSTCTGATGSPPCFPAQTLELYNNTSFAGVEFHWFKPVATIARRVQIGLNIGVGADRPRGTVTRVTDDVKIVTLNPVTTIPVHTEETPSMSSDWMPVQPNFRVEAMAGVILGPAFKIKAGGGIGFPGSGFHVTGVYFFGGE